eukprot:scaffold9948_cov129-Skeletonema_dohrnii-CCMP3373.AAC.9
MSKELQFRFDSITMLGGTSVSPSVVAFDKRTLYLGQNWTIKLKELNRVNIVQEESNDDGGNYSSSNDRRYNRYNSGGSSGQQRRHGASHQGTIVTLQGKGKPFTCITTTNNSNNDEFHNFLEALKQMHRKVKLKNNEKDPYAASSAAASNNNRRGGGGIMRSNSRKPLITPTVSRSNQQQQQQQQSRSSLHMTPQKMKQSTGAFLSRNRTKNHDDDGAHSNNKSTRGNVLNDNKNTSPSLNLPPKSPRNATPTKLRRTSEETDSDDDDNKNHDEFEFDDSKDDSKRRTKPSSRVLFHDSVVKRDRKRVKVSKLQRRIEEKMLDDRSDEEDDDDVDMKQTEEVMEEEEEENNVMMKKKRLRKVAVRKDDGEESDGSDLEFDAGTSSTTGDVRKKLRLEDDDDEEDEEDEGENKDSPSPAREEKVKKSHASGKTITDEDTSRETSPVTTEDVVAADNDDDDLEEGEVSSTPEEKPSAKKGPGTLHNFFAPRLALSTSSSKTTAKSLPPSTPVPPTPTKKKQALHPSTPSSRSSSYTWQSSQTVETTPIAMQKQANRWDSVATTTPKKPANPSPALFSSSLDSGAYYNTTPRKTPAGGYGSDYEDEEVDDIYGNDTDENTEPPTPPIRTTYHQLQQRNRNQISRRGRRQVYEQRGRGGLGRARIPHNPYQNDFRRGGNRISEADSALGRKNLGARTLGRDMSRRKLGKASLFPAVIEDQNDDDEEEVDDKPKIPGIQNLGNTCYLSASLQTLYSIPQFLHKLYQSYEELCSFKELPLTTALLEVAVTIGALKEEDVPMISPDTARSTLLSSEAANPSALKKQMDVLTDKFAGYEQRDAHEFLGDLVDFLHEELVDSPSDEKDDESKKSEESNSEDAEEEKPATV